MKLTIVTSSTEVKNMSNYISGPTQHIPVRTGIPSSHSHRLIIPDDVLIKFDLLMMSTVMLETCTEMK